MATMDDEQRRITQERLASVKVLLAARNQLEGVARLAASAPSVDALIVQLRNLLECSDSQARHVISTPLRMYQRGQELELEARELEDLLKLP